MIPIIIATQSMTYLLTKILEAIFEKLQVFEFRHQLSKLADIIDYIS